MVSKGYNKLQHYVCVDMGFCGGLKDGEPTHVDDFIPDVGQVTVDQFVRWLFKAEGDGYSPDFDAEASPMFHDLRNGFIRLMGSESVDASLLKWDV